MRAFQRLSIVLALVGAMVGSSFSLGSPEALALTEEEVIKKLRSVPVFTIANSEGMLLTAAVETNQEDETAAVAPIFIDPQDAQAFLDRNKKDNSQLADVKVTPLPLSEVYKLEKENRENPEPLVFQFFPAEEQVNAAIEILKKSGRQVEQFDGVPLFVGRAKDNEGLMVVQIDDQPVLPFFFEKEQLQGLIERAKREEPNSSSLDNVEISVLSLDSVVNRLLSDNDPQLDQVLLVPPQENIEYVRSQQPESQEGSSN